MVCMCVHWEARACVGMEVDGSLGGWEPGGTRRPQMACGLLWCAGFDDVTLHRAPNEEVLKHRDWLRMQYRMKVVQRGGAGAASTICYQSVVKRGPACTACTACRRACGQQTKKQIEVVYAIYERFTLSGHARPPLKKIKTQEQKRTEQDLGGNWERDKMNSSLPIDNGACT
jgi:hypothetical protein